MDGFADAVFFITSFGPEIDAIDVAVCEPQAAVMRVVFGFIGALFHWPPTCHMDIIAKRKNRIQIRLCWSC